MPKLTIEHYGTGDQTWLGSTHGINNARTVTLDPARFTKEEHYPDGYLRSGQPLTVTGDVAGPYVAAGEGEEGGDFHGFLLTDQVISDESIQIAVPLLDHGRVITAKLPGSAFTIPAADKDKTTFVYA